MKSITSKLSAIFLLLALVPLFIGVSAGLSLQAAGKALRENDAALQSLSATIAGAGESIRENVSLQDNATVVVQRMTESQAETSRALTDMRDRVLPKTYAISRIRFALSDATSAERALLLALNMRHLGAGELNAIRERQRVNMNTALATINENAENYRRFIIDPGEGAVWKDFETALGVWKDSHAKFMEEIAGLNAMVDDLVRGGPLFAASSREAYDAVFVHGRAARVECERLCDALSSRIREAADARVEQSLEQQAKSHEQLDALSRDTEASRQRATALNAQIEVATDAARTASAASERVASAARRFRYLVGICILGVVAAVVLGIFVSWRLSRPLTMVTRRLGLLALGEPVEAMPEADLRRSDEIGKLSRSLQELIAGNEVTIDLAHTMATGDFTHPIALRSAGDRLGQAMQTLMGNTNGVLGEVNRSVSAVNNGARAVSEASRSLSQGAETSAQALEEIAASVLDVNRQAKDNETSALEAKELATASRDAARRGYDAVSELATAMNEIRQAGGKIASVVKLIDDIAFQTNLLALNAAVEAARAGRHGRGFSVVADEVRSLSGRSAKAARETGAMVAAMTERMEFGSGLAERSDGEFREIVDATNRVAQLFEDIVQASKAQSHAMGQISQGLGQIDEVVQETTHNANWTADSAQVLSRQADDLQGLVSRFRIMESSRGALPLESDTSEAPTRLLPVDGHEG